MEDLLKQTQSFKLYRSIFEIKTLEYLHHLNIIKKEMGNIQALKEQVIVLKTEVEKETEFIKGWSLKFH